MKLRSLLSRPRLLASLPFWVVRFLAGLAGWRSYVSTDEACKIARQNIYYAFPELSRLEKEGILQQALRSNAKTLLELPRLWRGGKEAMLKRISDHKGLEVFKRAHGFGKGVIVAVPYVGNWEVVAGYLAAQGVPFAMSATFPVQELGWLAVEGRTAYGAIQVTHTGGEEEAYLQTLKEGGIACLFPDAVPEENEGSLFAPLFRGAALTSTLLPRLARASGALVVYAFAQRIRGGKNFRIQWILGPQEAYDADPQIATTAVNSGIKLCVKRKPGQYLWSYPRFVRREEGGE